MREIKFRGRHLSGQWYYGNLIRKQTEYIICDIEDGSAEDVEEETVGQFTGLYDKSGKEVYEGDILKIFYHGKSKVFGIAKYTDTRFYIDDNWNIDHSSSRPMNEMFDRYEFEVIGNVYDNPELLKEDEKTIKGK